MSSSPHIFWLPALSILLGTSVLCFAELLYISVLYHTIKCVHKHKINLEEVKKMGYRRKAYYDQFPGNGPFSHLPPWQRPGRGYGGRGYGRGYYCAMFPWRPRWWWTDPAYANEPPKPNTQDELAALEESKKALGEEKASIEQEINDLETTLKELKSKLESEKKPAGQ